MSRSELIKQLKNKYPNIDKSLIERTIDNFCQSIVKALEEQKRDELRGLGTFFIKKIKEKYSARNPKTGETIYVPEKNKVRFRPSKKLKEFINK